MLEFCNNACNAKLYFGYKMNACVKLLQVTCWFLRVTSAGWAAVYCSSLPGLDADQRKTIHTSDGRRSTNTDDQRSKLWPLIAIAGEEPSFAAGLLTDRHQVLLPFRLYIHSQRLAWQCGADLAHSNPHMYIAKRPTRHEQLIQVV